MEGRTIVKLNHELINKESPACAGLLKKQHNKL